MGSERGDVSRRLAVTVAVPIVALLLARVPLPGVDARVLEGFSAARPMRTSELELFGILSLELRPFIGAALLVELLALGVPQWRRWRLGGYPERSALWAWVKLIALAGALVQAFFFVRWLRHMPDNIPSFAGLIGGAGPDALTFAAETLSLVGAVFLLAWGARLIDRHGAANGFSVLMVAFMGVPLGEGLLRSARMRLEMGQPILIPLVLVAVAAAVVIRLAGGRPLRVGGLALGVGRLPTPASGLQPIFASYAILRLPGLLARWGWWSAPTGLLSEKWTHRSLEAAATAVVCALFAWLFNQPEVVVRAWRAAGVPQADEARMRERTRAAFARALNLSVVICWGLLALEWTCADAGLVLSAVEVTWLGCVVADVAGELRFRSQQGAVVGVWPVHRVYALQPLLQALGAAGIPAFPRGRHHRTLWNFFAPFVPIDILVPLEHAQRAEAILRPLATESAVPEPAHEGQCLVGDLTPAVGDGR